MYVDAPCSLQHRLRAARRGHCEMPHLFLPVSWRVDERLYYIDGTRVD
jgi:hypothetical protein